MSGNRILSAWLFTGAALVALILIVGGITRLTGSGLSITEWNVIGGVVPPMNEQAWQETFETYRQFPEYQQKNRGMSLDEFKTIYLWEFWHRILARLLGVAFIGPFLLFWWQGMIARRWLLPLGGLFLLGGLQGFLGWFMVQSGLIGVPEVSHLRLAFHLTLACIIFLFTVKLGLRFRYDRGDAPSPDAVTASTPGRRLLAVFLVLVFVQIFLGGMVAGLKAGAWYNTWPLMGGYLVAPEVGMVSPWWRDLLYNGVTVQFLHRLVALLILFGAVWLWYRLRKATDDPRLHAALHLMLATVLLQVAAGIITLLLGVPIWLAVVHQAIALGVIFAIVRTDVVMAYKVR